MSSYPVDLSSEHSDSDSQNYARDTPVNQRLVDESQTTTSADVSIREGIEAVSETIQATTAGSTPKKKKKNKKKSRSSARSEGHLSSKCGAPGMDEGQKTHSLQEGEGGEEGSCFAWPFRFHGTRSAFFPYCRGAGFFSSPDPPTRPSSPSLAEKRPAEKRPSEGMASQSKDKQPRTSPEPVDLPKSDIPPPHFPDHDPLPSDGPGEDYKGSWFTDLDLDASSSDDEEEEDAPLAGDAPSSA
ncbi:hypothetical protein LIER_22890 [Lithospermum erythrorhizon]|uniref:Uncharacterized protein n=1 Tax=Lithospermum erythrorhizon TaxID=34254 RepID=A0AAV3QVN2_LITER